MFIASQEKTTTKPKTTTTKRTSKAGASYVSQVPLVKRGTSKAGASYVSQVPAEVVIPEPEPIPEPIITVKDITTPTAPITTVPSGPMPMTGKAAITTAPKGYTVEEAYDPEYAGGERATYEHVMQLYEETPGGGMVEREAVVDKLEAEGIDRGKAWDIVRRADLYRKDPEKYEKRFDAEIGSPIKPYQSEKILQSIRDRYYDLIETRKDISEERTEIYGFAYDKAMREQTPETPYGQTLSGGGAWWKMTDEAREKFNVLGQQHKFLTGQIGAIGGQFETAGTPSQTMPGKLLAPKKTLTTERLADLKSFTNPEAHKMITTKEGALDLATAIESGFTDKELRAFDVPQSSINQVRTIDELIESGAIKEEYFNPTTGVAVPPAMRNTCPGGVCGMRYTMSPESMEQSDFVKLQTAFPDMSTEDVSTMKLQKRLTDLNVLYTEGGETYYDTTKVSGALAAGITTAQLRSIGISSDVISQGAFAGAGGIATAGLTAPVVGTTAIGEAATSGARMTWDIKPDYLSDRVLVPGIAKGRLAGTSLFGDWWYTPPSKPWNAAQLFLGAPGIDMWKQWMAGRSGAEEERLEHAARMYKIEHKEATGTIPTLGGYPIEITSSRANLPRSVELAEMAVPFPRTIYQWPILSPEQKREQMLSGSIRAGLMVGGIKMMRYQPTKPLPMVSYQTLSKTGLPLTKQPVVRVPVSAQFADTQATAQVFKTSVPLRGMRVYGEMGGPPLGAPSYGGYVKGTPTLPSSVGAIVWKPGGAGSLVLSPQTGIALLPTSPTLLGGTSMSPSLISTHSGMRIPILPEGSWNPFGSATSRTTAIAPVSGSGVAVQVQSTATMTPEQLARQSGVSPLTWAVGKPASITTLSGEILPAPPGFPIISPTVFPYTYPSVSPVVFPGTTISPILAVTPSSYLSSGISPVVKPYVTPAPTPYPWLVPTPTPTPIPIVTQTLPVPPSPPPPAPVPPPPIPKPPWEPIPILPPPLSGLGGGVATGGGAARPHHLGYWEFGEFFAGVHPLTGKLVRVRSKRRVKYGAVPRTVVRSRTSGSKVSSDTPYYKKEYVV